MLFFSFFKTLVDQEVTVELKNDIEIKGTLKSVDQYLNLKLDNISGINETKYPHLSAIKNLFIRGSTVRYVHMDPRSVDCTLLQDASRRGKFPSFSFHLLRFRIRFPDTQKFDVLTILQRQ
ncbi:Piso0_004929 [Millerozyma farinosa CBS 7064]|uniref:Piso0_004929 protein n=1 Tax=Pichia sorbitophila (strain ATCC MYA-4447 / BCRC 22081 / CBS 7064 / NBRC 10061 / NRRL Y-12695) TaxID=559304 RepID=G8Y3S2_PICSO|nr:Piso0_004929 [Millerozyma farinosa CBS 7064]